MMGQMSGRKLKKSLELKESLVDGTIITRPSRQKHLLQFISALLDQLYIRLATRRGYKKKMK